MFFNSSLAFAFSFVLLFPPLLAQRIESDFDLTSRSYDISNDGIWELTSRSTDDELDFVEHLLARAPTTKSTKASTPPPPIPPKSPLRPAAAPIQRAETAKSNQAAPASAGKGKEPASKAAAGSSSAAGPSNAGKGKEPAKAPYKAPNLLEENAKNMANKPVKEEKSFLKKAADKIKAPFQSKDKKNYEKLYGDPNPSSTPNLKKLINKESEITTGTKATQANFEKFQKPRYEAKLDRIKPQGDVAAAKLNVHNNKWKGAKDGIQMASQLSTLVKNVKRSVDVEEEGMGLAVRALVRRHLIDEDIWG